MFNINDFECWGCVRRISGATGNYQRSRVIIMTSQIVAAVRP